MGPARGCRCGYLGIQEATISPTLKGLCLGCAETKIKHTSFQYRRNRVALTDPISFHSQRSRNGNVGLKDATALRLIPPRKSDLSTFNWRTALVTLKAK